MAKTNTSVTPTPGNNSILIPEQKDSSMDIDQNSVRVEPIRTISEDNLGDEDSGVTEQRKSESYENHYINPEVGFIVVKKPDFAVLKTSAGYEVISVKRTKRKEAVPQGLKNIFKSFPKFEELTEEKIRELSVDDRTKSSPFALSRHLSAEHTVLLPNGETINLSVLKRGKGKSDTEEKELYRTFREILSENIDELNKLSSSDFTQEELSDFKNFVNGLFKKIGVRGLKKDELLKAVEKSDIVRKVLEEYFKYFGGVETNV